MLDYLYTFTYCDDYVCNPLVINAHVYAMAEKYEIPALKRMAAKKTANHLDESEHPLHFFVDAIKVVWTTTPSSDKGLRSLYIAAFLFNYKDLISDTDMKTVFANHGGAGG